MTSCKATFWLSLVINSDSSIRYYSNQSILKSELGQKVKSVYQTKNRFYALYENNFLILPDGKTIVGVDEKTEKILVTEDIITNKPVSFGKHEGRIQTLLYDEVTESLFAGDQKGYVKQYKRGSSNNPFNLVKDYGDVGIYSVYSSALVGRFALFGGCNFTLVAIDIQERRLFKNITRSLFLSTFSLQVFHNLDNKVYLSIGGYEPYYYLNVSDFLDVTKMYNHKKNLTESNQKKAKFFKHYNKIKKRKMEDLV